MLPSGAACIQHIGVSGSISSFATCAVACSARMLPINQAALSGVFQVFLGYTS